MFGSVLEDLALPHVLCGPGLGWVLKELRFVEIRVLVLGHPASIMQ